MSSVWCLCDKKLWSKNDGKDFQGTGLCEICLVTGDARKSPHWVELVVPERVIKMPGIEPIKTKADKKRERRA